MSTPETQAALAITVPANIDLDAVVQAVREITGFMAAWDRGEVIAFAVRATDGKRELRYSDLETVARLFDVLSHRWHMRHNNPHLSQRDDREPCYQAVSERLVDLLNCNDGIDVVSTPGGGRILGTCSVIELARLLANDQNLRDLFVQLAASESAGGER